MVALLIDENFDNRILRGLLLLRPDMDVARVQDVGLFGAPDPDVLEFAAQAERIVLTHDVTTMTSYVYERLSAGKRMPGMCVVKQGIAVGPAIEDLLLLLELTDAAEWEGQIRFIPL